MGSEAQEGTLAALKAPSVRLNTELPGHPRGPGTTMPTAAIKGFISLAAKGTGMMHKIFWEIAGSVLMASAASAQPASPGSVITLQRAVSDRVTSARSGK